MVRSATVADAVQISAIYNHDIADTVVSFEEEPLSVPAMAQCMQRIVQDFPWLIWEESGEVLGYAYATHWHERSTYRHSMESTIYLRPDAVGRRMDSRLYEALAQHVGIAERSMTSEQMRKIVCEELAHAR